MSIRIACAVATLALVPSVASGQLHLITGTRTSDPDEAFASALFVVEGEGSVRQVVELVPEDVGVKWIGISYDLRKSVILPHKGEPPLVVDLDTAKVVKHCASPSLGSSQGLAESFDQWLSVVPGRGATFEWDVHYADPNRNSVQGMSIDPAVPCQESFLGVSPTEMKYMVAHGEAGVGEYSSGETPLITMQKDGNLARGILQPYDVSFDYQVPVEFRRGLGSTFAGMPVNNSEILVAVLVQDEESIRRVLALRKRDKTWHVIPIQGSLAGCIRGFGELVAITETRQQKGTVHRDKQGGVSVSAPLVTGSVGQAEWRKGRSRFGPDMEESFMDSVDAYPGVLHLFDVETEKMFTITTGQGDSEILLVEAGTIYYRVSDRLYSAPLTDKGIGTAHLVATDEVIRDVHWAFIKH